MQKGFRCYVNNLQLFALTKSVLKKNSVIFPLLYNTCNSTKMMHLVTKKTILWFHLELTEIFRKYLGKKKCREELSFYIPNSSIFLQSLICILARDIGNSVEAI